MKKWLTEEESGQGMTEYALIMALIVLMVVGGLRIFGESLQSKFQEIADFI